MERRAKGDRGYRAALRVPVVRRLTLATSASVVGDYLGIGALVVMAADRTGGLAIGAASVFAAAVPVTVLVGTVGGPLLDRFRRVPALVSLELLGAVLICLPLLIDGAAIVFVTAALLAGQRTATGAIRQGVIAQGVPTHHRGPLIALTNTIDQGAQVIGYLTGAAIYLLISPAAALLADAASYGIAALVLVGISLPAATTADASVESTTPARGPTAGFRVIAGDPVLRLFALLVFFSAIVAALPETLAPVVLGPDDARASLLLAAAPLGQAVTIVILGRTATVARPWFQLWHLVLLAGGLTIASVAPGFEGLLAANVVVGVGVAWVLGPQLTFLRLVPPARMAQVTGAMWAAIAVAEGGGALLLGAFADVTSPRAAYLVAGVLVAVTAVVGISAARRSEAVTALELRLRDEVLV